GRIGVAGREPRVETAWRLFDCYYQQSRFTTAEATSLKTRKKGGGQAEGCKSATRAVSTGTGRCSDRASHCCQRALHSTQRGCCIARFSSAMRSFKRDAESSVNACGGEIEDFTLAMLSKDLLIRCLLILPSRAAWHIDVQASCARSGP